MASTVAIASTCEAIIRLLRSSYDPAEFNGAQLDFQVYVADDFLNKSISEGVSLFLYRIYHNGNQRTPQGRMLPNGRRQRAKLPVDLHFLLTAWAPRASLQHQIAGWMMRVLEDNPILPAGLLNSYRSGVFQPEETVELALTELSTEDMFRIWEVMIHHVYQLSVPYVARTLAIETPLTETVGPPVQERQGDFHWMEVRK